MVPLVRAMPASDRGTRSEPLVLRVAVPGHELLVLRHSRRVTDFADCLGEKCNWCATRDHDVRVLLVHGMRLNNIFGIPSGNGPCLVPSCTLQ
jgi:hypothetical protein